MKKVQKGFTLVELIVVITILAILGTIAFISLQGYSQDAKNSKVSSDIRTLASAIETKLTESSISIHDLNTNSATATMGNHVDTASGSTATFASGVLLANATDYQVGNIAFTTLGQNGEDFEDPNNNQYVIATLTQTAVNPNTSSTDAETFVMYQLVGEAGGTDTRKAVVKGNYLYTTGDIQGLVSASGSSTTAITHDLPLTTSIY